MTVREKMKSILLIRHGQSEYQVKGLTSGWTDTDLTELGRRQAACLASRLKREMADIPCQMYCSDLKRALQTAEIIGAELGLIPHSAPELREFNNGIAANKTQEEAKQLALERTEPVIDWKPYPEAETWRQFYLRVAGYVDCLTRDQDRLLLLVTHGGTLNAIISWWMRVEIDLLSTPSSLFKIYFEAYPTSLTVLRVNEWHEHTIERLNDTTHLYEAGLSEGINVFQESR